MKNATEVHEGLSRRVHPNNRRCTHVRMYIDAGAVSRFGTQDSRRELRHLTASTEPRPSIEVSVYECPDVQKSGCTL